MNGAESFLRPSKNGGETFHKSALVGSISLLSFLLYMFAANEWMVL